MNDVIFRLKNSSAKNKTVIFAFFHFGHGKRLKLSTGISILPEHWNHKKRCIKSGVTHQYEINKRLSELALKIQKTYLSLEEQYGKENVNVSILKEALNNATNASNLQGKGLLDIYRDFIIRKSKLIDTQSIKTYNTTYQHLLKYQNHSGKILDVNHLDTFFYNTYCGFCFDILKLAPNTVGRDVKNIKAFIKDLKSQGLFKNIDTSNFKSISVPSFSIALSEEDLQKIYELDLTKNTRLQNVRVKFLLACYTGMRISDLFRFSPGNLTKDTLEYVQSKTGEKVFLPRHDELNKILALLPEDKKIPSVSSQKYNKYLKELCMLAGLNQEINVYQYVGRNKVFISKKKYELVSSHTARKTFATIGISKGIPAETLMKFTGHSTLDVFLKYVKMPPNVYMDIIKKAWSR